MLTGIFLIGCHPRGHNDEAAAATGLATEAVVALTGRDEVAEAVARGV